MASVAAKQPPVANAGQAELPRPLVIPTIMSPRTLDDVRELVQHLPEEHRSKTTWRYVASQLDKAADGEAR